ncbi:MAG: pilin [Patescibacteria group bacterium]|nr:pilin [Patescibacteria group bacterium]
MIENPLQVKTISELINSILGLVLQIGLPVAVVFIIYSGFLFVTARGDPKKLTDAKSTFLWTVVGTAVLLGASVIAGVIDATIKQIKG